MTVIDYGDAPIIQQDGDWSSKAIRRTVSEVVEAGAIPLTLGGDHWITNPCIRAVAERHGPLGLVHFDAHNDTDPAYLGLTENNHSTVFHSLVDGGARRRPAATPRSACAATTRSRRRSTGSASRGSRRHWMHDVRDRGIRAGDRGRGRTARRGTDLRHGRRRRPRPRLRARHRHPRSGRHDDSRSLLGRARDLPRLDVVGADVVEVAPLEPEGADITAFAGHYVAREFLNGIGLRRASSGVVRRE